MLRHAVKSASQQRPQLYLYRFYSTQQKKTIAFVGTGEMGKRMCPHLFKKEPHHIVKIFDLNKDTVNQLVESSNGLASAAQSLQEAAKDVDVFVTMLPGPKQVSDVYSQILPIVKKDALLIDCSTIDPQTSREVAEKAELQQGKNLSFVDAPVSGGVGGAEAGTLTFMVGAKNEDVFARAKPFLELMGKNIVHCGASGTGQVAKICNNLILGITMTAVSEAMILGTQLGADPAKLAQIINTSSGRCWSSDTYNPYPGVMPNVPSSRDYTGGFACDLMLKDIGLAVSAADSVKSPLPLGKLTKQLYTEMSQSGMGKKDFSGMLKFLKEQKGGKQE